MTNITTNFLITLSLSTAFLLVTIGAALEYKSKVREYRRLGSEDTQESKDVEKGILIWRRVTYFFSLLILVPLTVGLHFSYSVSNPSSFIIINFGGDFAAVIVLFLVVRVFKTNWRELFTSPISLGLCVKFAFIGFLATLTILTAASLLLAPQLRQALVDQFRRSLGGN